MKLINKTNKQKKGFSLVELLAVLGVGGAMVAGALMLVSDVQEKRAIKTHSENISTIYNNMQSLFSSEPVPSAVKMEDLITAGVFPASMSQTGTAVKTLAGGDVTIKSGSSDGFQLLYNKVAVDTCVEILRSQKNVGWDKFDIKKGSADADPAGGTVYTGSSIATIASACKTSAAGDDWVSLGFIIN
tara:strand:- start:40245 stop:40805 length:561 start_codon:yes stop_codon:yes gene_type:complete